MFIHNFKTYINKTREHWLSKSDEYKINELAEELLRIILNDFAIHCYPYYEKSLIDLHNELERNKKIANISNHHFKIAIKIVGTHFYDIGIYEIRINKHNIYLAKKDI